MRHESQYCTITCGLLKLLLQATRQVQNGSIVTHRLWLHHAGSRMSIRKLDSQKSEKKSVGKARFRRRNEPVLVRPSVNFTLPMTFATMHDASLMSIDVHGVLT